MSKNFITQGDAVHSDFPWCHVESLSTPDLTGSENLLLYRSEFPPGSRHLFHHHPGREEIIYVLEGEAEQWVGTEKRLLTAGQMAFIPAGLPHATCNVGGLPLKILAILSPCETEGEFTVDVSQDEPYRSLLH